MRSIIIDLQNSDTWKIQLKFAINFIFSKDAEIWHIKHSSSSNIIFTSFNDTIEVVDELFESLCLIYQEYLETSTRVSNFIFDSVQLMYYKLYKVNFIRSGSYIDSPD